MVLAIIQARTSSTRLPGKILKPLAGLPMIVRQIERLKRSAKLDQIVVATSSDNSDDELIKILEKFDIPFFRGPLANVFERFALVINQHEADVIVRITADCPLLDPEVVDGVISKFLEGNFDYVSSTVNRTFPRGLDVEAFSAKKFLEIYENENLTDYEKEHVTPHFYLNQNLYKVGNYSQDVNLSHLRWTVDTAEDFKFVSQVYDNLYDQKKDFSTLDVLQLLEKKPELVHLENEA